MIGACVALAQASGDSTPLTLAKNIAGFVLSSETESSSAGAILTDGSDKACTGDCMQFKGIAVRYLGQLYTADTTQSQVPGLIGEARTRRGPSRATPRRGSTAPTGARRSRRPRSSTRRRRPR